MRRVPGRAEDLIRLRRSRRYVALPVAFGDSAARHRQWAWKNEIRPCPSTQCAKSPSEALKRFFFFRASKPTWWCVAEFSLALAHAVASTREHLATLCNLRCSQMTLSQRIFFGEGGEVLGVTKQIPSLSRALWKPRLVFELKTSSFAFPYDIETGSCSGTSHTLSVSTAYPRDT